MSVINYYKLGYQDREKDTCRCLSHLYPDEVKEYTRGWMESWADANFKKTVVVSIKQNVA